MIINGIRCICKKLCIMLLVLMISVLLVPTVVFATNGYLQEDVSVLEAGQTLDGTGFFAGNLVRVDGNVEGTAFAAGQDVTINGNINGDLFVAAKTVSINGTVTGNIFCAGQYISINSKNTSDSFVAGQDIIIKNGTIIGRDLFIAGATGIMDGSVNRDFKGGLAEIAISGMVGRDVSLDASKVAVGDTAVIKGDLLYRSENEAYIGTGSQISGQTHWQYVERTPEKTTHSPLKNFMYKLLSIGSALLVWFIITMLRPGIWEKTAERIIERPLKCLGTGALAFFVTPVAAILLMVTVIGLPAGIILGIAYAVSLYVSKIIIAVFIGAVLAKRLSWPQMHKGVWLFLLGLLIITVLGIVPVLKIMVWLVVAFFGLGAIITAGFTKGKKPDKIYPDAKADNEIREIPINCD